MTDAVRIKYRHAFRNRSCGQALVEGVAALWLLVTAFVLLLALGLNLFFVTQRLAQANLAATQAAKVIAVNRYWLGAVRPDWTDNKSTAETNAKSVATKVCGQFGLGTPTVAFNYSSDTNGDYNEVDVTVSPPLPFQLGSIFPSSFGVKGVGVDFEPLQKVYCAMSISAVRGTYDPNKPEVDVVYMPAYGYYHTPCVGPGYVGETGHFGEVGIKLNNDNLPANFRGLPLSTAINSQPTGIVEFCPGAVSDGQSTKF